MRLSSWRNAGRWILIVSLAAPWTTARGEVDGAAAPAVAAPARPAPPVAVPEPRVPAWGEQLDWRPDWPELPLGVGHLGAAAPDANGAAWVGRALLPLYECPGGRLWGWLAHGWLLELDTAGAGPTEIRTRAMVETSYEAASFVVAERRRDGWFRFRYDVSQDAETWSHATLLDIGVALAVETWPEVFDRAGALHFRRQVPHVLRAGPDAGTDPVTTIGLDHELELLETRGDWIRVQASQPAKSCAPSGEWRGTVHEGWVRWRDTEKGPWVWYYTRGC